MVKQMKNSKFDFAGKAKWIISFTFILGVSLTFLSELLFTSSIPQIISNFCANFGTALIVSSILGLFLELTEIKDFFEKRILGILSKYEFIDLVDDEKLTDMAVEAVVGLGRKRTNNYTYEYLDFAYSTFYEILGNIGEIYRRDFYETYDYSFLTYQEVMDLGIEASAKKNGIIKCNTSTRYSIISPKNEGLDEYSFTFSGPLRKIGNLDTEKQFKFIVQINGEKIDIDLAEYIKTEDDLVKFEFTYAFEFESHALIEIESTIIDFDYSGSISMYVPELTHNATIHFSSREELDFEAEFFGITANHSRPSITSNSVSLHYPGWALPGHGYFINWRKKLDLDEEIKD